MQMNYLKVVVSDEITFLNIILFSIVILKHSAK